MYSVTIDSEKTLLKIAISDHITVVECNEILEKIKRMIIGVKGSLKLYYILSNISIDHFCHEAIDLTIFAHKMNIRHQVVIWTKDDISVTAARILQNAYKECAINTTIVDSEVEALKKLDRLW